MILACSSFKCSIIICHISKNNLKIIRNVILILVLSKYCHILGFYIKIICIFAVCIDYFFAKVSIPAYNLSVLRPVLECPAVFRSCCGASRISGCRCYIFSSRTYASMFCIIWAVADPYCCILREGDYIIGCCCNLSYSCFRFLRIPAFACLIVTGICSCFCDLLFCKVADSTFCFCCIVAVFIKSYIRFSNTYTSVYCLICYLYLVLIRDMVTVFILSEYCHILRCFIQAVNLAVCIDYFFAKCLIPAYDLVALHPVLECPALILGCCGASRISGCRLYVFSIRAYTSMFCIIRAVADPYCYILREGDYIIGCCCNLSYPCFRFLRIPALACLIVTSICSCFCDLLFCKVADSFFCFCCIVAVFIKSYIRFSNTYTSVYCLICYLYLVLIRDMVTVFILSEYCHILRCFIQAVNLAVCIDYFFAKCLIPAYDLVALHPVLECPAFLLSCCGASRISGCRCYIFSSKTYASMFCNIRSVANPYCCILGEGNYIIRCCCNLCYACFRFLRIPAFACLIVTSICSCFCDLFFCKVADSAFCFCCIVAVFIKSYIRFSNTYTSVYCLICYLYLVLIRDLVPVFVLSEYCHILRCFIQAIYLAVYINYCFA